MHYLADVGIFVVILLAFCIPTAINISSRRRSGLESVVFSAYILALLACMLAVVGHGSGALGNDLERVVWWCSVFALLGYAGDAIWDAERRSKATFFFTRSLQLLRNLRGVNLALALYLVVVFLITFLLTLAPPNGADYDSLTYHLAAPAQYLRVGGIVELPYDHHTYFPFTMEMLFLLGLALKGPVLAKLFHWLMLPLCCFALIAMGRRHLTTRAGLFGAALFASIPLVQSEATTAYVDLGFTAFVLLAFLCFANWLTSHTGEENNVSRTAAGGWRGAASSAVLRLAQSIWVF
jgi:hypothetical protein